MNFKTMGKVNISDDELRKIALTTHQAKTFPCLVLTIKKLEQVVQGHSVDSFGKRVDTLMKTKGIISNLCFIEIKTHTTELLEPKPYRASCWAPSRELAGAITQVQSTVASAIENLSSKINPSDSSGNPTGGRNLQLST